MIKGNLEKWTNIEGCSNLLLFSQLVREQLFDYSIPSNRVATLNSNYLCKDAIFAIGDIEKKGVPQNSLIPIVEELYESIKIDPVFKTLNQSPLLYFLKSVNGSNRVTEKVSELNYGEKVKAVNAIQGIFFEKGKYYLTLEKEISDIIINNDLKRQKDLYRLIKSLLTELLNIGFSQQYIYYIMDKLLWNSSKTIDNPTVIKDFFSYFSFENKKYDVVLIVDKKEFQPIRKYFNIFTLKNKLSNRGTSNSEKVFLEKRSSEQAFLVIKEEAIDPFSAAKNVKETIEKFISIYKLHDHNYNYDIGSLKCAIYHGIYFYKEPLFKSATKKISTPSKDKMLEKLAVTGKAIIATDDDSFGRLITAVKYHSHALDSNFEGNQLLDFWAIFESVMDISNKHTHDRIEQVCSILVPILKRKYLYTLFLQLIADIKEYSEDWYKVIVGEKTNEADIVKNTCYFVLLDDYKEQRNKFVNDCIDFPLLAERIDYYNDCLKDVKGIFNFVEKHGKKVRWQIMRIYRNRNLIIHSGDQMPYLSLLIENLHSYVDDFLDYIIRNLSDGITVNTLSQKLYVDECEWNSGFVNKKEKINIETIDKMLCID